MPTRVLFVGLDAADPDLLEKWALGGHLPTIGRLLEVAAYGRSDNPPGLYVGAIWPSFSTAVSPARHGRYCFTQLIPGNYASKPFLPTDLKAPPFWDALSEAGQRIALIDVPKTAVTTGPFNGIQVVDWGTHDPEYDSVQTWPRSLKDGVIHSIGTNPIHDCNGTRESAAEFASLRDELIQRIGRKTQLVRTILDDERWDAVIAVFSESHCIGHQCWHIHDETHPRHSPAVRRRCGDPMLDVYKALDASLAELLAQVEQDTYCVVFASHGMGPHYEAGYLLDEVLQRLEQARYGGSGSPASSSSVTQSVKRLWRRLPAHLRRRWAPAYRAAKSVGLTPNANRRYFRIPNNDVFGGVRINVEGREPRGKVQPGAEFDRVCDELTEDLHTLVNQESGRKLVTKVLRTDRIYQGPYLDHLPDLMIEWDRTAPVREICAPLIGTIRGEYSGCRTGDHKAQGQFFATGPGVEPGRLGAPVSVMDFGPTIACALDTSLPDVDGRVIERLFTGRQVSDAR